MCSHNGVLVDDGLTTLDATLLDAGVDLLNTRVRSLETVQQLLESRGQTLVGLDSVGKESVTASIRGVEDVQESRSWGLLLVGNIRVPRHGAHASLEKGLVGLVSRTAVHEVNLGVSLWRARGGVDMVTAKVASKLESLGDGKVGKVLVSEGHDLALGDVPGELVLAGFGELAQLDALDLCADGGGEVRDLGVLFDEVGESRVCVAAVVVVLKGLEGRVDLVLVPGGEVVGILESC